MKRETLAYYGIGLVILAGLVQTWFFSGIDQAPWFLWAPSLAILSWSIWQLQETPESGSKAFDFNPKRGLTFFFFGFILFPILCLVGAAFGEDLTLGKTVLVTAFGSLFVGVVGIFTEHVGA